MEENRQIHELDKNKPSDHHWTRLLSCVDRTLSECESHGRTRGKFYRFSNHFKQLFGRFLSILFSCFQIEVLNAKDSKPITKCSVTGATKITEIKELVARANKKLTVHRQSIRLQQSGKSVKDDDTVDGLNLRDGSKLYVKDLGPQIGWKTVR